MLAIHKPKWQRIWYMLCFLMLGIIDQRRGSAIGNIQMAAANCVGVILAALLVPSLNMKKFKHKIYLVWSIVGIIGGSTIGIWGWHNWIYREQWVTGVLNVVVWGYFVIYALREHRQLKIIFRLKQPFFWCIWLMFLLMEVSVHEGIAPLWMLFVFGGFYLLGITKEQREDFFQGMLNGIIAWFFIQQIVAFGLRPYDYPRYKGMYSGQTQNGIFYMVAYCAFLCKWMWMKINGKNRVWVCLFFWLSASSIGFLLFTGGRSSLAGAAMATLVLYSIYDLIWKKSFYKWIMHIALFCICIVIAFPIVYGAIRYFPTILHHPIWFEGEYNERISVRSFDPWDSERYVTFEEAFDTNIGRILSVIGIDIKKWKDDKVSGLLALRVHAAELRGTGSSQEDPFALPDFDKGNDVSVRKSIFAYYFQHLNMRGHKRDEGILYMKDRVKVTHAHNMLIQMAYDYGISAGILFLGLTLYSLIHFLRRAVKGEEDHKWICLAFFTAVFFYGMTEMAIVPGMITWVLLYLLFYFAGEDSFMLKKGTRNRI